MGCLQGAKVSSGINLHNYIITHNLVKLSPILMIIIMPLASVMNGCGHLFHLEIPHPWDVHQPVDRERSRP